MPFLISASRRTDIPAFFTEWFRSRLEAGWCETRNPFSKKVHRVSLNREDVLGWIFWSRNYAPFIEILSDLHADGQRFICHFTINGFPLLFEPRVPSVELSIETAHTMADMFGADTVLWRYDPILLTSLTPPSWHRENFEQLANLLKGATKRCYFSFPTLYRKTIRNLEKLVRSSANASLSQRRSFRPPSVCRKPELPSFYDDPDEPEVRPAANRFGLSSFEIWTEEKGNFSEQDQRALIADLSLMAERHGIETLSCCGEQWADPDRGIQKASCADWKLLEKMGAGRHFSPKDNLFASEPIPEDFEVPLHPTRQQCNCYKSIDIGAYQTCGHGCAYCYAVDDPARARSHILAHQPDAPRLG